MNQDATIRQRPYGVIDIGSNSVRLVVYNAQTRIPIPLHNEKAMCALGKGLEKTGRLNADGVGLAFDALARFVKIAEALDVEQLDVLATAAVRDAVDGKEFANAVEKRCGVEVQVLTGKQEAKRSALGVLCGVPDAEGVVADLGGGSLELVHVGSGDMSEHTTLPLGLLRLSEAADGDRKRAVDIINRALEKHKWVAGRAKDQSLYAVGGAWRALARVCIAQMNYPLHVLDNFTLERAQALSLFEVISRLSPRSLEQIEGVSKGRLQTLPLAATVLERLIEITKPRNLVFSIYGMREGQFYKSLPESIRKQDSLIGLAEDMSRTAGRSPKAGHEAFEWMAVLFPDETPKQKRLRLAACILRDVWWMEHPDYRGEQAFLRILRLPFLGLGHEDRAGLALAMYYRYGGESDEPIVKQAHALLEEARIHRVKTIGLALRLAYVLAPGATGILKRAKLTLQGKTLVLTLNESEALFSTGSYPRRLQRLAAHVGYDHRIDWK
ncbi:MAG: Ppx/GppA family phosphatase [Rhodospirillaceae bacterium]|nr:Ppx/GppA family phosphatase [Rhodospirillaceae bacterium]